MLTINTNLSSLIVQSNLKTSTNGLNDAIERMTTGFKLNHAKDNAANYSISTSLTTKLGAYTIAEENAMMGLDMVQTASSSLSQMSDLASRLRSLATQAQNGTYGSTSLDAINSEANAIVKELFRIQNTTQYNGINLLNGGTSTNIATNAIATLSTASTTSTQSSPRATSSGFIEAVQKRDTSAMTTLASVDENTTLDSGTYSISTAEELAKLATMTNNGKVNGNAEFVLANDIDLSAYRENGGWTPIGTNSEFSGTFDGNGYKIKNLYINRPDKDYQGLFGSLKYKSGKIFNTGVENASVIGRDYVAGLVGFGDSATISNSYSTGTVTGRNRVGGLVGYGGSANLTNSYFVDKSGNLNGIGSGTPTSGTATKVTQKELKDLIAQGILPSYLAPDLDMGLQIGINGTDNDQLGFSISQLDIFSLDGLSMSNTNALETIDDFLKSINEQQTSLGAIENRLMSAIESIGVNINNLTSTRSTIKDADIAELSSEYIRNQILQQASATLLATANQNPSIALQLI